MNLFLLSDILLATTIILGLRVKSTWILVFAFFFGFFLDIALAKPLGFNLLFFIFIFGFLQILKSKFFVSNFLVPFFSSLFIFSLFRLLSEGNFRIWEIIFFSLVVSFFAFDRRKEILV